MADGLAFPIGDAPWRRLAERIEAMPSGPDKTQALIDFNAMLVEHNRALRATPPADDTLLRRAVMVGPASLPAFPNLPARPTLPDVLDALAFYLDRDDERHGNPNRDVQATLREWATNLRAALRATPPVKAGEPEP